MPAQADSAGRLPADPASGCTLADRVVDYSRVHAVAACAERPASAAAAADRAASGSPLEHSASAAYHPWVAAVVAAFRVDIVPVREASAWVAFPVARGTVAEVVVAAAAAAADNVELGVAVEQIVAAAAAVVVEPAAAAVDTVEEDSSVDPWSASVVPVLAVHPLPVEHIAAVAAAAWVVGPGP